MNNLFTMVSSLNLDVRRIIISGNVREEVAAMMLEQLTAFEYIDVNKPVSVYIDSFGGDASSAFAIYDCIKSACCPIITICMGKAMSAAALILAAGEKGNRFISPNSRTMIHQVSSGAIGNLGELEVSIEETRQLQDIYVELLAKETGQPKSKILDDILLGDYFMSAQETIKYGLADKIIPVRKPSGISKKKTIKKGK